MCPKKFLKFPSELTKARQQSGKSQKAVAISLGIDQSLLCALERGRRPIPTDDLVVRLADVLNCEQQIRAALLNAALHDRVMANIVVHSRLLPVAHLISVCLLSTDRMSEAELQGLAAYVEDVVTAKEKLTALTARQMTRKEASMS